MKATIEPAIPPTARARLRGLLQRGLGLEGYLYAFCLFKLLVGPRQAEGRRFAHFLHLLPEEGVALDVGANVGFTSVALARRLRRGHVHAFEPCPPSFRTLGRVTRHLRLRNVRLHSEALGDTNGPIELVVPREGRALLPALARVRRARLPLAEGQAFTAEARRLDELIGPIERDGPVAGVKLDVEGHELAVLRGAQQTLRRHRPILFAELWDNEDRPACLELLAGLGYDAFVFSPAGPVPFTLERRSALDFLLLPRPG